MLGSANAAAMGLLMARSISTSALQQAAPALATKSGGVASLFGFGVSSRVDTPLSEALPASVKPLQSTLPSAPPKIASGALDAGTKVIAVDGAAPVSAVTLVFSAGSAYESGATLGASKVLEAMAFKATSNRTTFRLTRELEKIGAVATAKAGRDHIAYSIGAVKLHAPEVVEILLDSVLNARFNHWEVVEAVAAAKAALTAASHDPAAVLSDVLHRAAYDGGLGQPLSVDASLLDHITNETLHRYLGATFSPSQAVLAAAGVGLDEFKQLANPLVSAGGSAASASTSSTYVGGALSVLVPTSPLTYVGLGFEAKGGLSDAKSAAAAAVVKVLLDEGRAVLPRSTKESDIFVSANGFSSLYKDTGLVGLLAAGSPAQGAALADAVCKKVEALAKGVSDAQLKQGKMLAVSAYKAQLATASGLSAALAPALLLSGKFAPTDFPAAVESLTGAEVAAFVAKGLKASPTFVTYGSMAAKLPRYEAVVKRFA